MLYADRVQVYAGPLRHQVATVCRSCGWGVLGLSFLIAWAAGARTMQGHAMALWVCWSYGVWLAWVAWGFAQLAVASNILTACWPGVAASQPSPFPY